MKTLVKKYEWGEDPELSGPRNFFRESLILSNLKAFVKKGKVLDAGCGNGSLSLRIIKMPQYTVEAIDLSKKSVDHLNNKIKKGKKTSYIRVRRGSLYKLPYRSSIFDGVVCGEVLEHLKHDDKALMEISRVIKPGGYCIITVPAKQEMWDITDDISGHVRRYRKEELEKKFQSQGFKIQNSYYWGFPLSYLWHTYVFLPFLTKKMAQSHNVTSSNALISMAIKNLAVQKILSYPFYIDKLFTRTNLGNCLLIVATKK